MLPPVVMVASCAAWAGLSTLELRNAFPEASLTALDLSPHFLAVARHLQRQREAEFGGAEPIRFVHAAAEETELPSETVDLVSCCLVMHELPAAASRALIAEAHRILRPGGTLAIMVRLITCLFFASLPLVPCSSGISSRGQPAEGVEQARYDIGGLPEGMGRALSPVQKANTKASKTPL